MKNIAKKIAGAVVGLGLVAFGMMVSVEKAYAYSDAVTTNSVTALTILITPNADRGVEISSGDVNVNLGSVDMSVSTYTVNPATITIVGTISGTELTLAAAIVGGWSFDSTPLGGETDKMATWALFSAIAISSVPSATEFELYNSTIGSDTPTQGVVEVGDAVVGGRYEGGWNGSDMDSMAIQAKRHLWIRMQTPSVTTVANQQTVAFNLTVANPN